jgi:hypothetical protein
MKRSLYIVAAVLTFLLLSAGCTKFSSQKFSSQLRSESDNNSSTATYSFKFSLKDESEIHTMDLQEGGSVRIKLTSSVKDGKVHFSLMDDEDKIIHEEQGKRFSFNESFSLDKGLYKIVLGYEKAEQGNLKLEVYSNSYFEYCGGREKDKDKKDGK